MRPQTITERFAVQVALHPADEAVEDEHETLTFEQLDRRSDQIAQALPAHAAAIGVAMRHDADLIAAILGILKTGAAYVPVEPNFPAKRIDYMMSNAGVSCVVTQMEYLSQMPGLPLVVLESTDQGISAQRRRPARMRLPRTQLAGETSRAQAASDSDAPRPEDLAYILYTSGTTGRPKGVCVEHRNVCHYVDAFENEFHPCVGDVMMQHSVCSFDIFVEEVFASLLNGAKLAIPSAETKADLNDLMDFVRAHKVTMISGFPYLLQQMNELEELPASLRLLISGGDVLRARYVDRLVKSVEVYNTYGPSETTVCASYYRCRHGQVLGDATYPVGKPVKGAQIALLDEQLQPVEPGEIGEICIRGNGVSRGYATPCPEQENFVQTPEGVLYRSGDMGYELPDGSLAFLHRKDSQVMIDGRRVEPAEVECALCECPEVSRGVIRSYVDEDDMPYLVGYYVPSHAHAPDDQQHIREHLQSMLAAYMVPESLVPMEALPLTPNGKVDTAALPHVAHTVF